MLLTELLHDRSQSNFMSCSHRGDRSTKREQIIEKGELKAESPQILVSQQGVAFSAFVR